MVLDAYCPNMSVIILHELYDSLWIVNCKNTVTFEEDRMRYFVTVNAFPARKENFPPVC